jgi:hypothetical protein
MALAVPSGKQMTVDCVGVSAINLDDLAAVLRTYRPTCPATGATPGGTFDSRISYICCPGRRSPTRNIIGQATWDAFGQRSWLTWAVAACGSACEIENVTFPHSSSSTGTAPPADDRVAARHGPGPQHRWQPGDAPGLSARWRRASCR